MSNTPRSVLVLGEGARGQQVQTGDNQHYTQTGRRIHRFGALLFVACWPMLPRMAVVAIAEESQLPALVGTIGRAFAKRIKKESENAAKAKTASAATGAQVSMRCSFVSARYKLHSIIVYETMHTQTSVSILRVLFRAKRCYQC